MICPKCHGRRLFARRGTVSFCPECEGRGLFHCCEGLQAQPEPEETTVTNRIASYEDGPRRRERTFSDVLGVG